MKCQTPTSYELEARYFFLKSRANGINDVEQILKLCFPDPWDKADAF